MGLNIKAGERRTFTYDKSTRPLEDYTSRSGRVVEVVEVLDGDSEREPVIQVRTEDGWVGYVFPHELSDEGA